MNTFCIPSRIAKLSFGIFGLLSSVICMPSQSFLNQWMGSKPLLSLRNEAIRLDKVLENQYMAMHCRWLFNLESTNK